MSERHSIAELNQLFSDGETADQELFAEQRSNIQLISGEHYARKGNKFWNRLRESKDLTQEQKIRLTKNHIRKIVLTYRNSITSYAPGVMAGPKDKTSMQDQKAAELVNSVWADAKQRHDIGQKINQWASDFVGVGEVAVKIFFDPNAGRFLGMEAEMDESGQVAMDENGQPKSSDVAKFSGDVMIERLFAFNLIRAAGVKVAKDSPWWCHRKMVKTSDIRGLVDASPTLSDDEKEKIKAKVQDSADQTYTILDGNSGQYKTVKDQTMLKEWFFKPCPQYPMGYFYLCTNDDIVFEGELPFGIYPIVFEGFDEIQTSPRHRSVVKQLRPYQIEINRCASKIAEHQITLGDDKLLVQNGTKLMPGAALPGVRSFQYSGMAPIVMAGRSGEQYLAYMQSQIAEMYQVAMIEEQKEEKQGNFDVYSSLYRSLKDKKKFSLYTDSFESFLKNVFKTYIQLKQKYSTPQDLIPAIGKAEYINIDEFKNSKDLCYVINIEAQSDDSESKLGKQLMLQHLIQYVGPQLAQKDLGKIIRLMPYANDEQILEDLTMDYDFAENLMLGLERGKQAVVNPYVHDPAYIINKLSSRSLKADYDGLSPQVKMLYQKAISDYQGVKTDQEMKIKQAQSEFIPTGGYLVACDFYVPDPNNPEKLPKRVRIPSESLDWLLKQLQSQGSDQKTLDGLSKGSLSDMSQMLMEKMKMAGAGQGQSMGPGQQQPPQQRQMPMIGASQTPQMGQTSPQGAFNGHY